MKHSLLKALAVFSFFASPSFANAAVFHFKTSLSGAAESPPNASPAVGNSEVWIDDVAKTLRIVASFSGLLGNVTVAHIHAPTASPGLGNVGVAITPGTLTGFPAGVTSGVYDKTFDLTDSATYTAGFLALGGGTPAAAQTTITSALMEGKAYLNIHTVDFPGGEIRGFYTQVPDATSTIALLGLGLAGLAGCSRLLGKR